MMGDTESQFLSQFKIIFQHFLLTWNPILGREGGEAPTQVYASDSEQSN